MGRAGWETSAGTCQYAQTVRLGTRDNGETHDFTRAHSFCLWTDSVGPSARQLVSSFSVSNTQQHQASVASVLLCFFVGVFAFAVRWHPLTHCQTSTEVGPHHACHGPMRQENEKHTLQHNLLATTRCVCSTVWRQTTRMSPETRRKPR